MIVRVSTYFSPEQECYIMVMATSLVISFALSRANDYFRTYQRRVERSTRRFFFLEQFFAHVNVNY